MTTIRWPAPAGLSLTLVLAVLATALSYTPPAQQLSLSGMVIGILVGMIFANSPWGHWAGEPRFGTGIAFCSKRILRLGIILYGFRLTFADVYAVGLPAIIVDVLIVSLTISFGVVLGRCLKMDREMALLTAVGSSICGAAAVLGAEAALRTAPYKTAVAVATVVIFGTLAMFLYPVLYRSGVLGLDPTQMGLFSGATLHEVAHVVGAGAAMTPQIAADAIIVKMIRVMLLVPVLFGLIYLTARAGAAGQAGRVQIPWFAVMFLIMIGVNSTGWIGASALAVINWIDTLLLTVAMTALGMQTSIAAFKKAGSKPFILAALLFVWLGCGGYALTVGILAIAA